MTRSGRSTVLSAFLAALLGAALAAGAALLAVGGGGRGQSSQPAGSTTAAAGGTRDVSATSTTALSANQIYKRSAAGVVAIRAVTGRGEDSGTGIVLNREGLILTNDHVIAGAYSVTVTPGSSKKGPARHATVVGTEPNVDLAVIRIDPSGMGLRPLKLVGSSSVQVGDPVYAIGNPYGLDETLTTGIVSALERSIQAPDGAKIEGAIQTDAPLNPGNSGGPLIDSTGGVIGVNSQIASAQASVAGSQPGNTGVGFAISSNTAIEAVKRIEAGEGSSARTQTESGAEESAYGAVSPYGRLGAG